MPPNLVIDNYNYNRLLQPKYNKKKEGTYQIFTEKILDNAGNQCGSFGYRKFTPKNKGDPSFDQLKFWSTTKGNNSTIVQDAILKIISFLKDQHADFVTWSMTKGNPAEYGYRALCQLFGVVPEKEGNTLIFTIRAKDYEKNKATIDNLMISPQNLIIKIAQISRQLKHN